VDERRPAIHDCSAGTDSYAEYERERLVSVAEGKAVTDNERRDVEKRVTELANDWLVNGLWPYTRLDVDPETLTPEQRRKRAAWQWVVKNHGDVELKEAIWRDAILHCGEGWHIMLLQKEPGNFGVLCIGRKP
jgi:hypothetical protein